MGLDMYLQAEKYVPGWNHYAEEDRALFREVLGLVGMNEWPTEDAPSLEVVVNCAYWRKANHIHHWFVKNVQDDRDDCKTYYVSREQLVELRDLCAKLLMERQLQPAAAMTYAEDELPPRAGFFFGGTEIDEWYWQDIEDTVRQLDRVLSLPDNGVEFYYRSSW